MPAIRRIQPYLIAAVYCAVPLATLAADNALLVRPTDLLPHYLVIVAAACLAVTVARVRGGHALERRVSVCAAVAVLVTFDYHELRPPLASLTHHTRPSIIFLWAILLGASVAAAAYLTIRVPVLPQLALAAGALMLMLPVVRYADARAELAQRDAPQVATGTAGYRLTRHPAPSIYFFLLDAYARPDRQQEQFGFDDNGFVDALRQRGFVVPPRTRSNYQITELSVPSILSMEYKGDPALAHSAMAGNNRVVKTFRRLGYLFALAPSEIAGWDCGGAEDICIRPRATDPSRIETSELTWAMLERTPGADLLETVDPDQLTALGAKRQFPSAVAKVVTGRHFTRPLFLFAHSLLAHTPYPFHGPHCDLGPGAPRDAVGYVGALECVNASTLAAVRVIKRADPGAVIVIASDHGTDVDTALVGVRPGSLDARRRLSNFVAVKLPRDCRSDVPPDLAAVNIFRLVLNCLTTARLPLLPYRRSLLK
jgi:hypothetical protein